MHDAGAAGVGHAHRVPAVSPHPAMAQLGKAALANRDPMMTIVLDIAVLELPSSMLGHPYAAEASMMNLALAEGGVGVASNAYWIGAALDIAVLHQGSRSVVEDQG